MYPHWHRVSYGWMNELMDGYRGCTDCDGMRGVVLIDDGGMEGLQYWRER